MASRSAPPELATILDFIRYAATRFAGANLGYGQGTFDPVEEATFLVAEALGLPVDGIDPFLPARLTSAERPRIAALIDKRIRLRTPAAYLLNCAYLQGTRFYVDERVIVPRSYLAELLYGDLFNGEEPLLDRHGVTRVLELCTGSGCLAVLACDIFPNAQVDATDISEAALEVAAINIAKHELAERVTLHHGDLFEPIGGAAYDLILANPPYVAGKAIADLPPEFAHEPRLALSGGVDGMTPHPRRSGPALERGRWPFVRGWARGSGAGTRLSGNGLPLARYGAQRRRSLLAADGSLAGVTARGNAARPSRDRDFVVAFVICAARARRLASV